MKDKIFLLSVIEYERYKNVIPPIDTWWWLRSGGVDSGDATYVNACYNISYIGSPVDHKFNAVRPVLCISTTGYNISDKIITCGYTWIVIDKDLVIAEMPISFRAFDSIDNDYESSEIREFLLNWYEERRELK